MRSDHRRNHDYRSPGHNAAAATTAAPAEETTTTAAPAPALSEVVFGLSGDPDTLDPHTTIAGNAWIALCNIFDGLTMLDYSSLEAPVPLMAGLAESWDISSDGTTYTFNLRQGVTFHDGTPWNSEAAVFNFRRWFDEGFEHYFETANATVAGSSAVSRATTGQVTTNSP